MSTCMRRIRWRRTETGARVQPLPIFSPASSSSLAIRGNQRVQPLPIFSPASSSSLAIRGNQRVQPLPIFSPASSSSLAPTPPERG